MLGKKERILAAVLIGGLLAGCSKPREASVADKMISDKLKSPSSYSAVSQKTLWKGKHDGFDAYIIKTEFDAQNGFGAQIRDCYYTSFTLKADGNYSYSTMWGLRRCSDDVGDFGYFTITEAEFIKSLVQYNKFSAK